MKNMKKILALVVAMMLVLGMVSAFAADTGSITVKSNDTVDVSGKTFKAYKILDAVFSSDGKNVSYSVPDAMKSFYDTYFKGDAATASAAAAAAGKTLDQYVAEEIAKLTTAAGLQAFVKAALVAAKDASVTPVTSTSAKMSGLVSGYYIIEDQATEEPISSLMLDTVNDANVDIVVKANVPTPDKELYEGTGTAKANNVTIGDTVNYVITQNVPNYTGYDYFYFIINDTLSDGLTFNNDIKVTVGGSEITASAENGYYLYTGDDADGKTFKIAFKDISKFDIDADIVVTYSAQLNDDAVVGEDPNTNDVYIEYSNNPEQSEQKDGSKPGIPASQQDHPTGEGPHNWTDTYTNKIVLYKVDATTNEKTALPGVQFTLTGTAKVTVLKEQEYYEEDSVKGTYYLLTNGSYTDTVPTTASSMTAAPAGATSGYVEETATYDGKDAISVGGKVYRPYKASDAGKDVYILNLANDSDYVSTVVKYSKKVGTSQQKIDRPVKMVGTTDSTGHITFNDLGAGTYTLSETKVPDGFNKIPDQTFTITCTVPADASVTKGDEKATWNVDSTLTKEDDGTFSVTIENKKGTELPSTGGMGTTLLYIGGSVLVILAAVLLITKRRMSAND